MGSGASKPSGSSAPSEDATSSKKLVVQHSSKKQALQQMKKIGKNAPRGKVEETGEFEVRVKDKLVKVPFAYVSQTGYYPNELDKANQDALMVREDIGGKNNELAYFGVYDGHGKAGDACANYVAMELWETLEMEPDFKDGNYFQALIQAHEKTNEEMHLQEKVGTFSDMMSGTTAVSALMDGDRIFVANVGDSRAIALSNHDGKLVSVPLSIDQTPFRHDERERVKQKGARVLTMAQIEGLQDASVQDFGNEDDNDGDPPRLWTSVGSYPGTAFTRSLGDRVAEEIGVVATPEVLERRITVADEYILLGSDGVFEFITSQGVADIFSRSKNKLLSASRAIVAEAYRQWLQFETRTDDITCIIIDVRGIGQEDVAEDLLRKRKGSYAVDFLAEEMRQQLTQFTSPAGGGRPSVSLSASVPELATAGADEGTGASGSGSGSGAGAGAGARAGAQPRPSNGGVKMKGVNSDGGVNMARATHLQSFQLDALSAPNAGGVGNGRRKSQFERKMGQAESKAPLLMELRPVRRKVANNVGVVPFDPSELDGYTLPAHPKTEEEAEALREALTSSYMFAHLSEDQLQKAVAAMEKKEVVKDEVVIKQFDSGDKFYVAASGRYAVDVAVNKTVKDPTGRTVPLEGQFEEPREVMEYICDEGEQLPLFGELALMYNKPRAATIRATADAGVLWALERKAFHSVLMRDSAHRLIKVLRKVKTFASLTYNEVARLVDLLTEVTFKKGEHIVTQGEDGDSFYVIKNGQASVTVRGPDGSEKEVMKLSEYEYFGERALLNDEPRAATVTATEDVTCLMIKKSLFDEVLGRLEDVLAEDGKMREDTAEHLTGITDLRDLKIYPGNIPFHFGSLFRAAVRATIPDDPGDPDEDEVKFVTLRRIALPTAAAEQEAAALHLERELEILGRTHTPTLIATFGHVEQASLSYQVFEDEFVADLQSIVSDRPLDPSSNVLRFAVRSVAEALKQLHQHRGILSRGVAPEGVLLDIHGALRLANFRFAKVTDGARTFTACGTPEYMAPEMITGKGHGFASDWWSLGILICELCAGKTPFADMNESVMYASITNDKFVTDHIASLGSTHTTNGTALLRALLTARPEDRLTVKHDEDMDAHPFMARVKLRDSPLAAFAETLAAKLMCGDSSVVQEKLDLLK